MNVAALALALLTVVGLTVNGDLVGADLDFSAHDLSDSFYVSDADSTKRTKHGNGDDNSDSINRRRPARRRTGIVWPNVQMNATAVATRTTLIPAAAALGPTAAWGGGVYIPLLTPPRPLPDDVRAHLTARADLSRGFRGDDVVVEHRRKPTDRSAPPGVVAGNMLEYPKWHGLIEAVHTAFINELPLTIKPDHIMLAILQSIGKEVNKDPELYRSELVYHKSGKVAIEVSTDASKLLGATFLVRTAAWAKLFPRFQQKMDEALKLPTELSVPFSSSTETDKLVRTIAVMDVVKAFISLRVSITCGLSSVTLEGTKADWVALRDRVVPLLARFGLSWKVELLQTLLSHFVAAFDGETDGAFWENLYNHRSVDSDRNGCVGPPPRVDQSKGWIHAFVTNQRSVITPVADWLAHDYVRPFETEHRLREITGNGLNSVPFVLDNNGHKTEMTFAGGFAYGQLTPTQRRHPVTGAPEDVITPVVGWTVSNGIADE